MSLTASTLSLYEITLDAGLADFAPQSEQLENLCFPWCNVADSAISALCKFSHLKALDLTAATFETEDYLSILASSCGDKLTELLLNYCEPTLPLVAVQGVLFLFTKLKSFSFDLEDNNTAVWDMSSFGVVLSRLVNNELDLLVSTCRNLSVLHLKDNCDEDKYSYTGEDEKRWQSLRPGLTVATGKYVCEHQLSVFDKFDDSEVW